MRILSLARDYPKAHSFASTHEVIHASLNPPDQSEVISSIVLPSGRFSIQRVLEQLPSGWQPDCIQISSSLGVFTRDPVIPTELKTINCPMVMKLTDSHFRHRPIQSLIEYALSVSCQYHWTTYDRHHLHFFREAGLPNVFWLPGSSSIQTYQPQAVLEKTYDVLFCGTNSPELHPRRAKLLNALQSAGVNVTITRKSYTETLETYPTAHIVFNCSLNGDLNRRVFETLMAGGFLITDRLAPESGLYQLFQEGVHLECYASEQELLEKIQYYIAHPDQAVRIAQQGHEHFMQHYHPSLIEEQFLDIVVDGHPIPEQFAAKDDDRTHKLIQSYKSEALRDRIRIYELIHDLHRCNDSLTLLDYGEHSDLLSDLRDLPRLQMVQKPEKAAIVLLDCPKTKQQLETALNQLQAQLQPGGIILLLGQIAKKFDTTIRAWGWKPIHLKESGEGACLVYQYSSIVDAEQSQLQLPINQPLNLSTRLVLGAKTTAKRVLSTLALSVR